MCITNIIRYSTYRQEDQGLIDRCWYAVLTQAEVDIEDAQDKTPHTQCDKDDGNKDELVVHMIQ